MRVTVRGVDGDTVRFECAAGPGNARWMGPPPAVGDERVVELASDVVLAPSAVLPTSERGEPAIAPCGTGVRLTARLAARFDEGTAHLAFADGSLVLDLAADARWAVGTWLTVDLLDLRMFDTRV